MSYSVKDMSPLMTLTCWHCATINPKFRAKCSQCENSLYSSLVKKYEESTKRAKIAPISQ